MGYHRRHEKVFVPMIGDLFLIQNKTASVSLVAAVFVPMIGDLFLILNG